MPSVARSIVRDSLRAKPDEAIIIQAGAHTLDLANEVALEAFKVGADPAILVETDEVFYGQFKHLTEEQLRKTSAHCLGIADYVHSYVWLGGVMDPSGMKRVPPSKWAALFEGEEAHYRKNLEKKQKSVGVALAQVTKARAKTYGFNYAAWKKALEQAITVDYGEMTKIGTILSGLLRQPAEVRVTADNGTDLSFRLAGEARRPYVDDGVISDEDIAAGNTNTSLPAGAVRIAPVEDSAKGTFVSDVKIPQIGLLIEGLSWTFDQGRVVDFTAKRNLRGAQVNYAQATGAKDMFGWFGLGINKKLKPGYLTSGYTRGSVTIGIGDNRTYEGRNESTYGFEGYLGTATVTLDGKPIVESGRLVV